MRKILGKHPNFEFFSGVLEKGWITCTESFEGQRRAEVEAMIAGKPQVS
jgi:hypothetical protein